MQAELGMPNGQMAILNQIAAIGALILSPIVGALADRFGVRRLVLIAIPSLCLLVGAFGLSTSSSQALLTAALAAVFTVSVSSSVVLLPVCLSFNVSRGVGVGAALAGSLAGYLLVLWVAIGLMDGIGWREALPQIAVCLGVIAAAGAALAVPSFARTQALVRLRTGISSQWLHQRFLLLLFAYAVMTALLAFFAPWHAFPMFPQGYSFPYEYTVAASAQDVTIATTLACVGMASAGFADDRWGARVPIVTAFGFALGALAIAIAAPDLGLPLVAVASGAVTVLAILHCARLVPASQLGLGLGLLQSIGLAGSLTAYAYVVFGT
jgi:MFS family permease